MANYIVSYDLNGPIPTHQQMDNHLAAKKWKRGRILETVWYIGTTESEKAVYAYIASVLSKNDRLIVVSAQSCTFENLLVDGPQFSAAWGANRTA